MASLGSKDHQLVAHHTVEYHLSQQLSYWKTVDPPPGHVKPMPFSIVQACVDDAHTTSAPFPLAIADMSTNGFFYLCHPGEHTLSHEEVHSVPFCLCDVVFYQGSHHLPPDAADYNLLHSATFTLPTYSNQKKAVHGETIGNGWTCHAFIGPVKSLARHVERHLRCHHAPCSWHTSTYCVHSRPCKECLIY